MKTLFRSTLLLSVLSLAIPGLVLADSKKAPAKTAPSGPIDLNNATQSQLESLNGVGPATAKKIIAGRPYKAVSDLSKAGVSAATISKISSQVTVGAPAPAPATPAPAPAAAPASTPAATPASTTASKKTPAQPKTANNAACGANMVWANTDSKVYHMPGDRWFGNTKKGKCMTEADAQAAGYHASKEGAAKKKTS
ncbi:MAG TPA: helix-hairpin-helix domain-containing protein [Bryobacteraceae bacterium]|jgi:hypothetical protein